MKSSKKFGADSLKMIGGNVLYAGCQWAMLMIMTKMLPATAVGTYALALAVTGPLILLANMNLRTVQATDVRNEYQFRDYMGLRVLALILFLVASMAFALFSGYQSNVLFVVAVVATIKVWDSSSDVIYGLLMQTDYFGKVALSRSVTGIVQLSLVALGANFFHSIEWVCFMLAVGSAIITFAYDLPNASHALKGKGTRSESEDKSDSVFPRFLPETLQKLFILTIPLGMILFLDQLILQVPRFFLDRNLGKSEVAYFSAISYSMVAGNTVIFALAEAARVRLARFCVEDFPAYVQLLKKLVLGGFLAGISFVGISVLLGKPLLSLMYTKEYAKNTELLVIIAIAGTIWYVASFLSAGITAARRFRDQLPSYVLAVLAVTLSSFILVPKLGIVGAGYSIVIGMALRCAGGALIVWKIIRGGNHLEKVGSTD